MVKHTTEIYGYGKWMERWKKWKHARCPCCNQGEDIQHIARCSHTGATATWEQGAAKLATWFSNQDTHPGISQIMLTRLQAWRQHQETQFPIPTLPALQITYLDQQEIGWFNFLQGRISTRWVIMQSDYYQLINSKRTATTWARRLICHLWELSRNMWLHRNHILHESPNAETEKLSRRMDRRILTKFWKNLDGLSPPHHYLLRRNPLNRVLKWQNHEKLAWLDTVSTIARRASRRQRSQARRQRQMIRNLSRTTAATDAT
jgi:hypothetical protein